VRDVGQMISGVKPGLAAAMLAACLTAPSTRADTYAADIAVVIERGSQTFFTAGLDSWEYDWQETERCVLQVTYTEKRFLRESQNYQIIYPLSDIDPQSLELVLDSALRFSATDNREAFRKVTLDTAHKETWHRHGGMETFRIPEKNKDLLAAFRRLVKTCR
jgi:hypothetical protein